MTTCNKCGVCISCSSSTTTGGELCSTCRQPAVSMAPTVRGEVERLRGMTCDQCRYRRTHALPTCVPAYEAYAALTIDICGKVSIPGHSVAIVPCEQLGNGCRAWEAI